MTSFATCLRAIAYSAVGLLAIGAVPLGIAATPAPTPAPTKAAALPTDSIYQLAVALTDQDGRTAQLDERRGNPMLISMFYTSCQFVCPMLIDALRDTQTKLSADERKHVSVLMVSFDPARDSVAVLKRTAEQRQLDPARWTLARTDPASVRKLAAVLGIQYRALANGDFNHTTALILIDPDGRITGRSTQLGNADPAFVKLVKAAAQGIPPTRRSSNEKAGKSSNHEDLPAVEVGRREWSCAVAPCVERQAGLQDPLRADRVGQRTFASTLPSVKPRSGSNIWGAAAPLENLPFAMHASSIRSMCKRIEMPEAPATSARG